MVNGLKNIEQARVLIAQAVMKVDPDDALSMLMAAAEIETGDVAGQFFSEFDDVYDHWLSLDMAGRSALLNRYLDAEAIYIRA